MSVDLRRDAEGTDRLSLFFDSEIRKIDCFFAFMSYTVQDFEKGGDETD